MKMRNLQRLLMLILLLPVFSVMANEDGENAMVEGAPDTSAAVMKYWTTNSTPALKVDEKYYNNWASSGNAELAVITTFVGDYKFTHSKYIWDNAVDLGFGLYWQDLDGNMSLESLRKNEDKIDLTSTLSMRLKNDWNVNASVNFKSQFYKGYKYAAAGNDVDRDLVSNFMAPGYLTTAVGFEYKREFWNVSASFLTGKITYVCDPDVIAAGQLYGVDTTGGRRSYTALGSYLKFYFKKEVLPKLNLYTRIEFFYDYFKPNRRNWDIVDVSYQKNAFSRFGYCLRYDTDVDFELTLEYRFLRWLAAYFSCNVKYDTDFATNGIPNSGDFGLCQVYQSAGLQFYFNYKTGK